MPFPPSSPQSKLWSASPCAVGFFPFLFSNRGALQPMIHTLVLQAFTQAFIHRDPQRRISTLVDTPQRHAEHARGPCLSLHTAPWIMGTFTAGQISPTAVPLDNI